MMIAKVPSLSAFRRVEPANLGSLSRVHQPHFQPLQDSRTEDREERRQPSSAEKPETLVGRIERQSRLQSRVEIEGTCGS